MHSIVALYARFPSAGYGRRGERRAQKTSGANGHGICTCMLYNIYVHMLHLYTRVCTPATLSTSKNGVAFVCVCARSFINTLRVRFCPEGRLREVSLFFPSVFRSGSDSSLYYYYYYYTHRAVVASQPVPRTYITVTTGVLSHIHNMMI